MARMSIYLLRPLCVTLDGEPITAFESDKVRALLAYLAVETGQPHRCERLAGLLWSDLPERSARTNLRAALFNLRSAMSRYRCCQRSHWTARAAPVPWAKPRPLPG
jgi:DNA-binding SARP family transcriptional activator